MSSEVKTETIIKLNADREAVFFSVNNLRKIFEKEAENFKNKETNQRGLFLEKLWSAIEFLLRDYYGSTEGKIPENVQAKLGEFYMKIFHRNEKDLAKKAETALEMQRFVYDLRFAPGWITPENIDNYAETNERWAVEELKKLKKDNPPFWVERKKGFSPELDVSKIPPWTARSLLEDYKRLAKKREPEKKSKPSFDE